MVLDAVRAAIGAQPPTTVAKRANSFLASARWGVAPTGNSDDLLSGPSVQFGSISSIWNPGMVSATKASGLLLLSPLRFAKHVVVFDCLSFAIVSRRIKGLSEMRLSGKTDQAGVLTVVEIRQTHGVLQDASAHMLALYGRCTQT